MWLIPLLADNDSPDRTVELAPCVLIFVGGGLTITQGGSTPVTATLDPCVLVFVGGDLSITEGDQGGSGGGATLRPAVTMRPAVTLRPAVV